MISAHSSTVEQCARQTQSHAFLAELSASVAPGPAPSTMYNARIRVTVRTRQRDLSLEACARRRVLDALRRTPVAVTRTMRARQTFHLGPRAPAPIERPPRAFSRSEAQRALAVRNASFARCLGVAGTPENAILQVAVQTSGQFRLISAQMPRDSDVSARACIARHVRAIRLDAPPTRRVMLTHTVAVPSRARASWY